MAENGWEVPTTKEELVELMPKMQEAGVIPIAFGNSNYQGAVDWLYSTFTSCYAGPDAVKAAMEGTGKYTDDAIKNSVRLTIGLGIFKHASCCTTGCMLLFRNDN